MIFLKQSHEILTNKVIALGNTVYVEDMNFAGLQKRAKETTINSRGRYNRKGRFGKSIGHHAPRRFLNILKRKLLYHSGQLIEVNTRTFKASQYNHVTDTYKKKALAARTTKVSEHRLQRDLYSAFLLMNSNDTYEYTDRNLCLATFDRFLVNHTACISKLRSENKHYPSSFGLASL